MRVSFSRRFSLAFIIRTASELRPRLKSLEAQEVTINIDYICHEISIEHLFNAFNMMLYESAYVYNIHFTIVDYYYDVESQNHDLLDK